MLQGFRDNEVFGNEAFAIVHGFRAFAGLLKALGDSDGFRAKETAQAFKF